MWYKGNCFYQLGDTNIIDTCREDGLSSVFGHTLAEVREQYPGADVMPFERAMRLCDVAMRDKLQVGTPHEIDRDKFIEMLEVLPPLHWEMYPGCSAFAMSELTSGEFTAWYVHVDGRYFCLYESVTNRAPTIIGIVVKHITESEAAHA